MKFTLLPLLGLILTMGACSLLGADTAPDDLSVEDHHKRSQEQAVKARKHREQYDDEVQVIAEKRHQSNQRRWTSEYEYRQFGDYYWGVDNYDPSQRHLSQARKHEELSRKHSEAAQALESFEEAQCASFPPESRAICPLLGHLVSAENVPNGSRVWFADDVDLNAAMAHMRCHIAFARSQAEAGMDDCPLYLKGVHVSRVEPGSAVDFVVEESTRVENLRKRVKAHLPSEPR